MAAAGADELSALRARTSEEKKVLAPARWMPRLELECSGKRGLLLGGHRTATNTILVWCTCGAPDNAHPDGSRVLALDAWVVEHCRGEQLEDYGSDGEGGGKETDGEEEEEDGAGGLARLDTLCMREAAVVRCGANVLPKPVPLQQLLAAALVAQGGSKGLKGASLWAYWCDQPIPKPGDKAMAKTQGKAWAPGPLARPGVGVWYRAKITACDSNTGVVKIKYVVDASEDAVYLMIAFTHFGAEPPPAGGQPEVLPDLEAVGQLGMPRGGAAAPAAGAAGTAGKKASGAAGGSKGDGGAAAATAAKPPAPPTKPPAKAKEALAPTKPPAAPRTQPAAKAAPPSTQLPTTAAAAAAAAARAPAPAPAEQAPAAKPAAPAAEKPPVAKPTPAPVPPAVPSEAAPTAPKAPAAPAAGAAAAPKLPAPPAAQAPPVAAAQPPAAPAPGPLAPAAAAKPPAAGAAAPKRAAPPAKRTAPAATRTQPGPPREQQQQQQPQPLQPPKPSAPAPAAAPPTAAGATQAAAPTATAAATAAAAKAAAAEAAVGTKRSAAEAGLPEPQRPGPSPPAPAPRRAPPAKRSPAVAAPPPQPAAAAAVGDVGAQAAAPSPRAPVPAAPAGPPAAFTFAPRILAGTDAASGAADARPATPDAAAKQRLEAAARAKPGYRGLFSGLREQVPVYLFNSEDVAVPAAFVYLSPAAAAAAAAAAARPAAEDTWGVEVARGVAAAAAAHPQVAAALRDVQRQGAKMAPAWGGRCGRAFHAAAHQREAEDARARTARRQRRMRADRPIVIDGNSDDSNDDDGSSSSSSNSSSSGQSSEDQEGEDGGGGGAGMGGGGRGRAPSRAESYCSDGRLIATRPLGVHECSASHCSAAECLANMQLTRGMRRPLEVFRTPSRTWGVRCSEDLAAGEFVAPLLGRVVAAQALLDEHASAAAAAAAAGQPAPPLPAPPGVVALCHYARMWQAVFERGLLWTRRRAPLWQLPPNPFAAQLRAADGTSGDADDAPAPPALGPGARKPPSRPPLCLLALDTRRAGNVARYVRHCERARPRSSTAAAAAAAGAAAADGDNASASGPTLVLQPVLAGECRSPLLYCVGLFAARRVRAGEELTCDWSGVSLEAAVAAAEAVLGTGGGGDG